MTVLHTLSAFPPYELLHDICMSLECLNRAFRRFVSIHFERNLATLWKAQHTAPERQVAGSPDRVCGVYAYLGLHRLTAAGHVDIPNLDGLIEGTGDNFLSPIMRPVYSVDLGFVRLDLRQG